jgi:Fur family ferric uptake transcriptional regulator
MSWSDRVLNNLSQQGHRVTGPRRAILEQITQYRQPFSAERLFKDLGGEDGPIGRATIYRTVDLLLEDGWLSRVHWSATKETTASSDHAYVPVEQGHRHHMVCRKCGTVVPFESSEIDGLMGNCAERAGFALEGHWLEIYGLCKTCRQKG